MEKREENNEGIEYQAWITFQNWKEKYVTFSYCLSHRK